MNFEDVCSALHAHMYQCKLTQWQLDALQTKSEHLNSSETEHLKHNYFSSKLNCVPTETSPNSNPFKYNITQQKHI